MCDGVTMIVRPRTEEDLSSAPVMELACTSTGLTAEQLGVVARLVVSSSLRRRGVGSSLLRTAASGSIERGRQPMLDVHAALQPAIVLYERSGWMRIGAVSVTFQNGVALDEIVYLAPDSAHHAR
jgi:ribosomal protein S18 acetylase RimI-like enzyme